MQSAQAQEAMNDVSCVMIPLVKSQLLLPNVCIAEILPWRRTRMLEGAPGWCLGALGWRGQSIAVIDFEKLRQPSQEPTQARSLVVMNRAHNSSGPAFYAIATVGLPRILQVGEEDVRYRDEPETPGVSLVATLGEEQAVIPDLGYLETQVRSLL